MSEAAHTSELGRLTSRRIDRRSELRSGSNRRRSRVQLNLRLGQSRDTRCSTVIGGGLSCQRLPITSKHS